jgi:hypothetical protein
VTPGAKRLERRPDGWPLCPFCGEDELGDLTDGPANPLAPLFCYRCGEVTVSGGVPFVPVAPRKVRGRRGAVSAAERGVAREIADQALSDTWAGSPSARYTRRIAEALDASLTREQQLVEALRRAVYIAEHLFQMVPREVWRDSGGDDGQGHYEGDYRAEQLREELSELAAQAETREAK